MAVVLWTIVPLAALHILMWRRWRPLLRFQLLLDLGLAVVVGPALVLGADLDPVRCLQRNDPFTDWQWSERTTYQPTQSDLVLQFHPWWDETRRLLGEGELPLVSERLGGGLPLLAHGQTGLWAPVMLPVWLLGPERGTTVMAFWKLELAGLGAFLYLACGWRLRWRAAALGGVAYGLGCYQVAWLLVPLSWATAALPWLWWGAQRLTAARARWPWLIGFGLGCGWLMGCGLHPETAAIAVGSAVLGGLVLHPGRWPRLLLMLLVALPVALSLAWPTVGAIRSSAKMELIRDERPNRVPLPLDYRLKAAQQLLVPMAHGHPGRDDWRAPYPYAPAAAGVGGVALAVVAVGGLRRRHRRLLWAALANLGVAAVLAYRLPPLDWLLVRLPPLDAMTLPRFAALVPWALALWAAIAADALLDRRSRSKWWMLSAMAVLLALGLTARPWQLAPADLALVLVTPAAAAAVGLWRRPAWLAPMAAVELALYAVAINPMAAPADRLPRPALVNELVELQRSEGGRVIGIGGVLPPNLASRYGLTDLRAYDPIRPHPMATLFGRFGEVDPVLGGALQQAPARLCGAWSVRFLVTPPRVDAPGWEKLWSDDSGALWRNPHWLPELRVVGRSFGPEDSRRWARLRDDSVDFAVEAVVPPDTPAAAASSVELVQAAAERTRVVAFVRCNGPCLLVAARPWAPGWHAVVDGEATPVVRTNLAGLGALVPEGGHRVELRYRPWHW